MTTAAPRSLAFPLTAAFFALALAVGGAGTRYPVFEMGLEVAAVLLLLYLAVRSRSRSLSPEAYFPLALIGLIILIAGLQLVPLPPSIWHELPGRERAVEVLALIGRGDAYMPLSLDPEATKRAALALLPGIAMVVALIHLSFQERLRIVYILVAFAILGATLGALQIASGGGEFTPFVTGHRDYGVGLFTNRNHQTTFLLIGISMTAAAGRIRYRDNLSSPVRLLALGALGLCAAGVLATTSRAGAALLLIVLPLAAVILYSLKLGWRSAGIGAAGSAVAIFVATNNSVVQNVISRFAEDGDRVDYWLDTLAAIRDYGIAGSGLGTFVPVHQSVERLSTVLGPYVNHAHNDYVELALEGGALAIAAFLGFALFVGLACWRLSRGKLDGAAHVLAKAALLSIVVILLHSVVDYPLRMLSLEAVFGLLCGLLVSAPAASPTGVGAKPAPSTRIGKGLRIALCLAISGMVLVQVVMLGLADQAVKGHSSPVAQRLAPWSADAASLSATDNLMAQNLDQAESLAIQALARSPLDVRAMSTLALVYELQGRGLDAARLMAVASSGGWRDLPTQLWLMGKAVELNDYEVAAQRADGLLRQNQFRDRIFPLLRAMSLNSAAIAPMAQRLADEPSWRYAFLHKLAELTPPQRAAHGALLSSLAGTEAPPTETEVAAHVAMLLKARDYRRARETWLSLSRRGNRRSAMLDAGGFEGIENSNLDSPLTPFEWGQSNVLDASVRVGEPSGSRTGSALQAQAKNGATGLLLKQMLVLEPGDYLLSFAAKADDAASLAGFEWTLECADSRRKIPLDIAPGSPATGWLTIRASFTVPADCPAQQLGLRAIGLDPTSLEAWFDEVEIVPRGTTG